MVFIINLFMLFASLTCVLYLIKANSCDGSCIHNLNTCLNYTSLESDVVHVGDLVINGNETMVIEGTNYFQQGNIYINDEAKLAIKNSQFMLGRGDVPTIHTYIFVREKASLEIENSTIFPYEPPDEMGALVVVRVQDSGNINITDSPTSIHLLEIYDNAQVTITNSEMIFDIGGLLQVMGGNTKLVNSTIGAIGLTVPANSHLNISGIESGVYLESWDVHDIIPDVNYDLVLEKTYILKDELEPGPYERGWIFFINPQAYARISNSELRKVFIDFQNESISLENLRIGVPSSLEYREIELNDIIIKGQWGITLIDSNLTISSSDYLFIQISGQSNLNMINSHMVEFIPRSFFGIIVFENCTWTNAGEIIGGQPYHSIANNFTIRGSLRISPELRIHLQWRNASVKRVYDALVLDRINQPIQRIPVIIDGKTFLTNDSGKTEFTLIFNETSYIMPERIEVIVGNKTIAKCEVDFFTETPIILISEFVNVFDVVWNDVNYPVTVFSNSIVSQFVFNQSSAQITFEVSGETSTVDYCNVTIPKALLKGNPWIVKIDDETWSFTSSENLTHTFIYFTYNHSGTFRVLIEGTWVVSEFPLFKIIPLFILATLLAVILFRRKCLKKIFGSPGKLRTPILVACQTSILRLLNASLKGKGMLSRLLHI